MPAPKKESTFLEFYGGKVRIEKKPWGDHFRFIKEGTKGGLISSTSVTRLLDKSQVLIKWAVGLVGGHITSFLETAKSDSFSREEISLVVGEAVLKPEEKKVAGGEVGDIIHTFAHDFAKAKIEKKKVPSIEHLDESDDKHRQALNGINAFLDWYNNNEVEFIKMEEPVYYNSLIAGDSKEGEPVIEYVGIMDLLARVNGVIKVVDYKTSKGVYSDQRYQVSSYKQAWNSNNDELQADSSLILNFGKETGDLIQKDITQAEHQDDFDFGFKGLYLVAVREKTLEAERNQAKKDELQ